MDPNEIVSAMGGQVVKDDWETGQEIPGGWFKFDVVGAFVKGTLVGKRFQQSRQAGFPDQWVYELQTAEGVVKVGIKAANNFINDKMKYVQFGQVVGFKYSKDVPSDKFKGKTAKSIEVKMWGMDPNYTSPEDFNSKDDEEIPQF